MKKIKELQVSVTYVVSLSDLTVPDYVFAGLSELFDSGESYSNDEILSPNKAIAIDWVNDNVKEKDAYEWINTIEQLEIGE